MKLSVSGEQVSFFERFGYVELEHFFSQTALQNLVHAVADEAKRRGEGFERDMALSSPKIRRILFSSSLGKCAFAMLHKRPLRYAFDLFLKGFSPSEPFPSVETVCVGPIVLSVLICVRPPRHCQLSSTEKFILSAPPLTEGGVTFVSPKTSCMPKSDFGGEYILLGYGGAHVVYRHEEKDPYLHALKRYGYLLNDVLKMSTHPLLLR